jgi:ABC-type branched-subunit amino acid transport system permease subunit
MLTKTRLGKGMRAVADNRDLAESSGIDVQRVILSVWILGGALTAVGGIFLGMIESVDYLMGFRLLLLMFAGVILGGSRDGLRRDARQHHRRAGLRGLDGVLLQPAQVRLGARGPDRDPAGPTAGPARPEGADRMTGPPARPCGRGRRLMGTDILVDALRTATGPTAASYALLAIGLNMHFGYTGLLNFGQAGFMLVGAYGVAITVSTFGGPLWLGVLVGLLGAVLLALLLGVPTLRLRADYLAITTIAAAEILRLLFRSTGAEPITGGVFGLRQFGGPSSRSTRSRPALPRSARLSANGPG